jgi:hypothetical protein
LAATIQDIKGGWSAVLLQRHRIGPHNLHENRPGSFVSSELIFATYQNVTTLQAQTNETAADRVTATPETARDLPGALSRGPEFSE